jgi:hypothetical protein
MKDLIKQILREETSGFDPKMLNTAYKMMDNLTKDCLWYYDTPEQRFDYTPQSIWLINPETKEWVLELEKSGKLWYYNEIYLTFKRYFNMEKSDFESFIKLWVEDALRIGVSTTVASAIVRTTTVEDALRIGVSTTAGRGSRISAEVEDALRIGVSTTTSTGFRFEPSVEDALKRGKELR